MNELETLAQAIVALESQRPVLGDAIIDAMLAPACEKLAALQAQAHTNADRRKHITVLFADVSGFTALSETLDAEDMRDTMNILWQQIDATITTHGGKIDKHIGDAVMALWGADATREDDPERAIRAALVMQTILQNFSETQGFPLQMRIGLNTGLVLLGAVGSTHEYTAMGDTVNVASRLEHAAPIGGILIAHDTYRQVRGVFDVVAQPPLMVKGKTELLETYLVQRAKPRAFRMLIRGVEGVETKMVGRDAEMTQLQTICKEVWAGQVLRALTVVADAGLGKSRLMQEFLHWAEVSGTDFYLFRGRTTPSSSDTPFALLRDILSFRFEILESDSLESARAKLENGMAALCPADEKSQEKAHFIGHLAGWDFSASPHLRGILSDTLQIRAIALHFLTLFFQNVASAQPVMFVLEDLHWADRGSIEALRHVLSNLPANTPLLVLANARPTLFERDLGWQTVRLDLRPLTEADSIALVANILRHISDLPLALRDLIVRQSDGNPFYAEELIKMLIDEKVILPGEPEWRVQTERLATLRVPPTLTGILQARLDSLPAAERLAIQRAAVIGRTFWDAAVHALSQEKVSLTELHAWLEALAQRELVFQNLKPAFAGTHEHRFKHAMLRDVAYETVLKRERAGYHARVAEWLESISGARRNEYLPQIAEHYAKAGNLAQAARCFAQAGDQAMRVSAFTDAVRFYRQVHAPNMTCWLKLAEAHYYLGEFPAARTALEQARSAARADGERAAVLALWGEIASELGDYTQAQETLAEAIPLARASGDHLTLCRALYVLGDVNWRVGNLEEARAALAESVALARTLGDVTRTLFALNRLAMTSASADEEERLYHKVYNLAVEAGNRERAMTALNNLGVLVGYKDQVKARDYYRQALAIARDLGTQHHIVHYLINLVTINIELGEFSAARVGLREGLAMALQLGTPPRVITAVKNFGYLAQQEGQTERALALYGLARRHPAWSNDHQRQVNEALAELALDPSLLEAGLKRGEALDWDATIHELLVT
ncbi:MAG: tetratricopeptide repeat protein [Chloroflexi bacterium]|nr:tetratricopeptide repeat protein [Chloroflexota bacterium]MBP8056243.1 tetratricopeptide repeat protein [Chloroflexota bacterium]